MELRQVKLTSCNYHWSVRVIRLLHSWFLPTVRHVQCENAIGAFLHLSDKNRHDFRVLGERSTRHQWSPRMHHNGVKPWLLSIPKVIFTMIPFCISRGLIVVLLIVCLFCCRLYTPSAPANSKDLSRIPVILSSILFFFLHKTMKAVTRQWVHRALGVTQNPQLFIGINNWLYHCESVMYFVWGLVCMTNVMFPLSVFCRLSTGPSLTSYIHRLSVDSCLPESLFRLNQWCIPLCVKYLLSLSHCSLLPQSHTLSYLLCPSSWAVSLSFWMFVIGFLIHTQYHTLFAHIKSLSLSLLPSLYTPSTLLSLLLIDLGCMIFFIKNIMEMVIIQSCELFSFFISFFFNCVSTSLENVMVLLFARRLWSLAHSFFACVKALYGILGIWVAIKWLAGLFEGSSWAGASFGCVE